MNEALAIESLFYVQDKSGIHVPMKLNPSQQAYEKTRSQRDIIAKARQKGFSTYGVALQTLKCLGVPGTRAVLISHEAEATQRLLGKASYFLKYINGPKPVLGRHSRNELYFPKTESTYYIGTAGSRAFGRGDTITDLHISEYAWWEGDALKHVAGLMQAVPASGSVRIESTGNGTSNDFYYMVRNAESLGYKVFFRSWWEDEEYTTQPPEDWSITECRGFEHYFQDMIQNLNLTNPQLFWYWNKLKEFRLNLKVMQQEYPSTLEECFQASGGQVFDRVELKHTPKWTWGIRCGKRCEYLDDHPKRGYHYVIGADPSGGTGNDEAVAQIFCLETYEQVLEFGDSVTNPYDFGLLLTQLGLMYNTAFIVCEANNHGHGVHGVLIKNYPTLQIFKKTVPRTGKIKYGLNTSEETKKEYVSVTHECLSEGLTIYGKATHAAMTDFHEDSDGVKLEGLKDHYVIGTMLACVGIQKFERYKLQQPRVYGRAINPNQDYMYMTFDEAFNYKRKSNQYPPTVKIR